MASNVSQLTLPTFWSSANDDVVYTFAFNPYSIDSISDDGNGFAQITLQNDFDITPLVGEYIFIFGSQYNGQWRVTTVIGTGSVVINTAYSGSVTSNAFNCYHLRVPTFNFYKGFKSGEVNTQFETTLPYTFVVGMRPSVIFDITGIPYLSINVKGVTKYLFEIQANVIENDYDFSMFNAIRFEWDGMSTIFSDMWDLTLVLNSAISNEELNVNYLVTGKYLLPIDKPLIPTQGVAFYSCFDIYGNPGFPFPILYKFIDGIQQ